MLTITGKSDAMYKVLREVCKVVRRDTLPILHHCIIDEAGIFGTDLEDAAFVEYPDGIKVEGQGVACVKPHHLIKIFGGSATFSKAVKRNADYCKVVADYTPPCEHFDACQEASEHRSDLWDAQRRLELDTKRYESEIEAFKKYGGKCDLLGNFIPPKKVAKAPADNQISLFGDVELPRIPLAVPVKPSDAHQRLIDNCTARIEKEIAICKAEGCRQECITETTAYTRSGKPIGSANLTPPKARPQPKGYGLKGQDFTLEIPPIKWIPIEPNPDHTYKGEVVTEIVDIPTPPVTITSGDFTAKLLTTDPTEYPDRDEVTERIAERA